MRAKLLLMRQPRHPCRGGRNTYLSIKFTKSNLLLYHHPIPTPFVDPLSRVPRVAATLSSPFNVWFRASTFPKFSRSPTCNGIMCPGDDVMRAEDNIYTRMGRGEKGNSSCTMTAPFSFYHRYKSPSIPSLYHSIPRYLCMIRHHHHRRSLACL